MIYRLSTLFLLSLSICFQCIGSDVFRVGLDRGDNIKPYLQIYPSTKDGNDRVDELWTLPNFVSITDFNESPEAKTYYWLKAALENSQKGPNSSEWVLSFDLALTDIEAFLKRSDGSIEYYKSGFFIPNKDKSFAPTTKANLLKFTIDENERVEVLFKVYSTRSSLAPVFDITVVDVDSFYLDLSRHKQLNLLYMGFVLMMLTYNVFMFFFKRDKANIYYSFYLFIVVVFIAYNTGNLSDWVQDIVTPNYPEYMYAFKLICYLGFVSYMKFIRYFLELKKMDPFWDNIFKILSWMAIPWMIGDLMLMFISEFSPNVSDIATVSYSFLFIVVTTLMLIPLSKARAVKNQYVLWGIIVMNSTIVLTLALRLQGIDFSTLPFKVGSIIEIVLFSLALVYRQQHIELEQQQMEYELEKSVLLQNQEKVEANRLKEFNEFKSNLYANMTHEFRTPLTVIMGMADRIEHDDRAKEMIKRSGTTMLTLVNQLLDLSKAEANELTINKVRGDIVGHVQYLFDSLACSAQEKKISINFTSSSDKLMMDFDPSIIQHIIHNLLSNAIKFTPIGGQIDLMIDREIVEEGDRVIITITDSGVGISQGDVPFIFDRFYQSPNNDALNVGTGIGLALVKELVELLKGTISVVSERSKGSSFIVKLPLVITGDSFMEISNVPSLEDISIEQDAPLGHNEVRPVVLIVEDDLDVMYYIKSCFDDQYELVTALNGKEGYSLATLYVPDIILTDYMMPKMDGVELVNRLKEEKSTSHIPIIMITAKTDQQDRLNALLHGAEAYMTKPFDRNELLIRVDALLKMRTQLKAYYSTPVLNDSIGIEQKGPEDPFIEELRGAILNNLNNELFAVEDLHEHTQLSRTQLYRKLKALTGLSGLQFINYVRIEEAQRLLLEYESMSISEISYRVGFSDPNYFSRKFSNDCGLSPKDYRLNRTIT